MSEQRVPSCGFRHLYDANSSSIAAGIPYELQEPSNELPTFLEDQLEGKIGDRIGTGSFGICKRLNLSEEDPIYNKLTDELTDGIRSIQFKSKKFMVKLAKREKNRKNGIIEIQNEINLLRELNDPRIIKVCGIITTTEDGEVGYIAPLVDGKDLYQYKKEYTNFNQNQCHKILFGLVQALLYLHEIAQIIHADFNPNNIMVTPDLDVVIIDFGLSSKADAIGRSGVGTDTYRPKELEEGEPNYGLQVDIYYLATTVHYLYTAKIPGDEFKTNNVWDKEKACDYLHGRKCDHGSDDECTETPSCRPFRPEMSVQIYGAKLKELLEKCWKLLPEDRPAIDKLRNELDRIQTFQNLVRADRQN